MDWRLWGAQPPATSLSWSQKVGVEGTENQDSQVLPAGDSFRPRAPCLTVQTPPWSQYMPDAVNVLDGIADLPSQFLLIKLHLW